MQRELVVDRPVGVVLNLPPEGYVPPNPVAERYYLAFRDRKAPLYNDVFVGPSFGEAPTSIWARYYDYRREFVEEYCWSLPCLEAVEIVAQYGPVLDICAGAGLWAAFLHFAGADVIATDAFKQDHPTQHGRWFPVRVMNGEDAITAYPDRTVFMSWPPLAEDTVKRHKWSSLFRYGRNSEQDNWPVRVLRKMAKDQILIYVGEGEGGCTGGNALFRELERSFELVQYYDIPQWDGIRDYMAIYRKVREPKGAL